MDVVISEVEGLKVAHRDFGAGYICITQEVLTMIAEVLPDCDGNLAKIIMAAESAGMLPYGTGEIQGKDTFYMCLRKPYGKMVKKLGFMEGDGTIIAAPVSGPKFKEVVKNFERKYALKMF